jgi:hypothetical protein
VQVIETDSGEYRVIYVGTGLLDAVGYYLARDASGGNVRVSRIERPDVASTGADQTLHYLGEASTFEDAVAVAVGNQENPK